MNYRLVAIADDGIESDAGLIDTLTVPPGGVLVVRIPEYILDAEIARMRAVFDQQLRMLPQWKDVPILIVRGADVAFMRLVPEVPDAD